MGELDKIRKGIETQLANLDEYISLLKQEREEKAKEFDEKLDELKVLDVDKEQLVEFLKSKEKFVLLPKKANEWYVVVPRFVPMNIGWLEHQTSSFNVFVINRYTQLIYDIPIELRDKIKLPVSPDFKVIDGFLFTGRDLQDVGYEKYKSFLFRREGNDRIRIQKGQEFALIAKLVEDGCLPFTPLPVDDEDLRKLGKDFELRVFAEGLRSYQEIAWQRFLEWGSIGIFWSFAAGKSQFGIYLLGRIKGNKLVVIPNLTLKEQWEERIEKYIPEYKNEVTVVTYLAYEKVRKNEYSLVIFDEVHHLPANTYIKLSTLNTKYRVGLSGSPFREDGRENYIFALTGFPIGVSWDELIRAEVVTAPIFKLYIVKEEEKGKLRKLEELLRLPMKTIIFCDSIDFGKRISKKFGIPFVYGESKDRIETVKQSDVCVVSRVGDEGISVSDLERVIEVSFLFGSRRQESQRFGRLMHSQRKEPEHIIIMTEEEFRVYQKRLNAIYERGFRIEVVR